MGTYVYVCAGICMCVGTYVYVGVGICVCVGTYVYVCVGICMCVGGVWMGDVSPLTCVAVAVGPSSLQIFAAITINSVGPHWDYAIRT